VRKTLIVILCALALAACENREDFPPQYDIDIPPDPTNLSVTWVQARSQYDLTWEIDDPDQLVSQFFVYLSSGLEPPDTIGTTTTTSFSFAWPFELSGLTFGVTSVSEQNVESDPAIAVTQ
jgi:hypothetical protein